MEFSYWEKEFLLPHSDIIIVGAGIVGLTTAIYTSQKFPNKNVSILEKGAFNNGASTRNAGFACFGSPTELLSDLKNMGESQTKELLAKRYYGLKRLQSLVSPSFMEYQACGGVEVFCYRDGFQTSIPKKSDIEILNNLIEEAIGEKQAMVESTTLLAKNGIRADYAINNQLEGSINTGKMIAGLTKKALDLGVQIINGVEVESYTSSNHKVQLKTNQGSLTCSQLVVCVNSFAKYLLPELEVQPGRNYVLVTEPIADFKLKGTFHMEEGYIYFRNVENRLLIGGGRHWFSDEESTDDHAINTLLKERLLNLSHELIPESKLAKITHEWTGILGLGNSKSPIIKRIDENIYCGLRLGGMGVAIGSEVGYQLSELIEP